MRMGKRSQDTMTKGTTLMVLAMIMEQKKPSGSLGVSRKDFDLISAELQTTELIRPTETTEYKAQHVEGAEKDPGVQVNTNF